LNAIFLRFSFDEVDPNNWHFYSFFWECLFHYAICSETLERNDSVAFCAVSAFLRISSAHFSAPLPRDVAAEVIEQLKERGNLRAGCPLSVVDFDQHGEDAGIVFLSADTQRGLEDSATSLTALDFKSAFIRPGGAIMRASAIFRPFTYVSSKRPPTAAQLSAGMVWNHIQSIIFADSVGPPISTVITVLDKSSASFARTPSDSFSRVNTSTNGKFPPL
jgi:hypothetical protein